MVQYIISHQGGTTIKTAITINAVCIRPDNGNEDKIVTKIAVKWSGNEVVQRRHSLTKKDDVKLDKQIRRIKTVKLHKTVPIKLPYQAPFHTHYSNIT